MMGIYSGGVLVALEELGCCGIFDTVYGESGGAINASYFLAGQGQLGITIYTEEMASLRFANPFRFGRMLNLDYAIDVVLKTIKPLDIGKVLASPSNLRIAVTDAVTGIGRIIDVKHDEVPLLPLLKATAAIVPLYNHAVDLGGHAYVDGGIACPVPVQAAIDDGCTHILVLLTQPEDHFATPFNSFERFYLSLLMGKWPPALLKSLHDRRESRYNLARDTALGKRKIQDSVSIAVISPPRDAPPLGKATIMKRRLLAAKEAAMMQARNVFREIA